MLYAILENQAVGDLLTWDRFPLKGALQEVSEIVCVYLGP